jgi:hypothetical protein
MRAGRRAPESCSTRSDLQAGAVDRDRRLELARAALDDDRTRARLEAGDLRVEHELAPGDADVGGERPAHAAVVDDAGDGHVQRAQAGAVRLELAQALGPDLGRGHAVVARAAGQFFELRELGLARGDHDLAAALERHPALAAEALEQRLAVQAGARLHRPGLVVEAGVHHARVAAGLVEREVGFLLEHDHPPPAPLPRQGPGRRQPDDPAPDHDRVRCAHGGPDGTSAKSAAPGPSAAFPGRIRPQIVRCLQAGRFRTETSQPLGPRTSHARKNPGESLQRRTDPNRNHRRAKERSRSETTADAEGCDQEEHPA